MSPRSCDASSFLFFFRYRTARAENFDFRRMEPKLEASTDEPRGAQRMEHKEMMALKDENRELHKKLEERTYCLETSV